jgi:cobalt-zinc-cadmium efflux system membrane fusion protein
MTEVVEGLEPGARIVVKNAFLLKAELGKWEAGHEH